MDWRLQRTALERIAGFDGLHCMIAQSAYGGKQERARRKCLEALLFTLEDWGCGQLILEAREERDNKRDIALLLAMRAKHQIGDIIIRHQLGSVNPLLWLPDQIVGAYGDVVCKSPRADRWAREWGLIQPALEVIRVDI